MASDPCYRDVLRLLQERTQEENRAHRMLPPPKSSVRLASMRWKVYQKWYGKDRLCEKPVAVWRHGKAIPIDLPTITEGWCDELDL